MLFTKTRQYVKLTADKNNEEKRCKISMIPPFSMRNSNQSSWSENKNKLKYMFV